MKEQIQSNLTTKKKKKKKKLICENQNSLLRASLETTPNFFIVWIMNKVGEFEF